MSTDYKSHRNQLHSQTRLLLVLTKYCDSFIMESIRFYILTLICFSSLPQTMKISHAKQEEGPAGPPTGKRDIIAPPVGKGDIIAPPVGKREEGPPGPPGKREEGPPGPPGKREEGPPGPTGLPGKR